MFKRILTILLVASMMVTTAFAANVSDFTDFPSDWSSEALEHAVDNGLLEGSDNKIDPKGKLSRAQMAAIMSRAFAAAEEASLDQYGDVDTDAWYFTELARAVQMGALQGSGDTMRPEDPITRQEAFLVLSRLFVLNHGDPAVLEQFEDGSHTASWAENGVASLVEAGYVHGGTHKRLNPAGSITRAEFAKVMDNMVSFYVDADTALQSYAEGNVLVRADGRSLNGMTIHGDLIIADGVSHADLSNVTVEGRLVIRGGSKGIRLEGTKAEETFIYNPNGIAHLVVNDSELGMVHLHSDVTIDGTLENVLEEGGRVIGDGSKPEPETTKLVEKVQLVDMGWAQYLAIAFAEDYSVERCTLTVDGVTINDAVTPVTDNGSIVKWEVTDLGHAKLEVSDGTYSQTFTLGDGEGKVPEVAAETDPTYFLLNGAVYVWDYHLTNYDDAGNIRVEPEKTTFSVDAASAENEIPHFSPDAIIHEDPEVFGKVTGTVELMFNYASGSEREKAFVDGITDVDLVSFQEYKQTLNDELTYTLDKEFAHGDGTVACIQVPVGQTNFTSNGRYRLRVTSNGSAYLFPIHLVNEVVPSMTVTGNTGYSGKEVHFRIENMTYGITSPIYRVELTNPAGETAELVKFDDWFLHGDLLVLYNDHTNYFPEDGTYTVKVWADGFQPFEKTFYQTAFQSEAPMMIPVDAIATASVGGGGSSGGGEGGGDTNVMNANLILNADLLVNAEIVKTLGYDNEAALGIAERWETMQALYVFNEGAETVYPYESYYDAVNTAKTQGEYLTFAEYIASESAVTTQNRPYAVKHVLEDNLLGETSSFGEAVGKTAPALKLTAQDENTVTFTCSDTAYLSRLAEGELFLNTTYPALTAEEYTVDAEAGTLTLYTARVGRNSLKINVPGYRTAEVIFEVQKVLEEVSLTAADIVKGESLVVRCGAEHENCDFLENITAVKLVAPNGAERTVRPDGSEGVFAEIGYSVENAALTIGKDIFDESFAWNEDGTFQSGAYQVILTAEHYGEKSVTVQVTQAEAPVDPSEALDAPVPVEVKKHFYSGDYQLIFGMGNDSYMEAISEVTVNGAKVQHKVNNITDGLMTIPAAAMQNDADNTVVISATGYKELTVTVAVDASGAPVLNPTVPTEPELAAAPVAASVTAGGFGPGAFHKVAFEPYEGITDYLNAITGIMLNGTEVSKVDSLWNEQNAYHLSVVDDSQSVHAYDSIDFSSDCFGEGTVTVVITAEGYEDLTFDVIDGKLPSGETVLSAAPAVTEITRKDQLIGGSYYIVSFEGEDEAVASYLDAVNEITVDGEKVKCVGTFFNDTMSYKTANDFVNGGAYRYLHFTEDCFAGERSVVISAEGYENLTFNVVDGALEK